MDKKKSSRLGRIAVLMAALMLIVSVVSACKVSITEVDGKNSSVNEDVSAPEGENENSVESSEAESEAESEAAPTGGSSAEAEESSKSGDAQPTDAAGENEGPSKTESIPEGEAASESVEETEKSGEENPENSSEAAAPEESSSADAEDDNTEAEEDVYPGNKSKIQYELVEGWEPHAVEGTEPWRYLTSQAVYINNEYVSDYQAEKHIYFEDDVYTEVKGLITFRGNNFRNNAVVGTITNKREIMDVKNAWTHDTTGLATPDGSYWTGNGWTGQPLFREWTREEKAIMTNMYDWAKEKDDLVEIIYASLDGYIYFMDLDTGEDTRDPLFIGRVFKGAGSLDPRGYPIMYVGSGYESGDDGESMIYIINLLDGSVMYNIGWLDPYRVRWFSYFDSSALVCAETDQLIYPGENGVLYIMNLNTEYDLEAGTLSVNPDPVIKYVYYNTRGLLGMEDSAVIFQHYLYIADNGGDMLCVDLETLQCVWVCDVLDDTNDSPVFAIEPDGRAYLYIAPAFRYDYRYSITTTYGDVPIYKIDAETGEVVWKVTYWCETIEDLAGGVEGTGYLGEGSLEDYFYIPMARVDGLYWGKLVAINRWTGEVAWEYDMDYSWSSPLCVYGEDGRGYVINCNFAGDIYMIDGVTGELVDKINLEYNIEASPAVYNNRLVVGTRGMKIWGIEFK